MAVSRTTALSNLPEQTVSPLLVSVFVCIAGQQPTVSVQVCQTADEPDSRSRRAPLCPRCVSYQRVQPEGEEAASSLSRGNKV